MSATVKDTRVDIPFEQILKNVAEQVGMMVEAEVLKTIDTQRPPDGSEWIPKSPRTLSRKDYIGKTKLWMKTGQLRSRITHRVDSDNSLLVAQIGIFDDPTNAAKATWLEYGTGGGSIMAGGIIHSVQRMPARPLFRIVVKDSSKTQKFIEDRLKAGLAKYLS